MARSGGLIVFALAALWVEEKWFLFRRVGNLAREKGSKKLKAECQPWNKLDLDPSVKPSLTLSTQ